MNIKQKGLKLYSDEEIADEFIKRFEEDIGVGDWTKDEEDQFWSDIALVENVDAFLISVLGNDRKRYFSAQKEQQDLIKGAFNRTLWMLTKIRKERDKSNKKRAEKREAGQKLPGSFKSIRHG